MVTRVRVDIESESPLTLRVSGELRSKEDVDLIFEKAKGAQAIIIRCPSLEGNSVGFQNYIERVKKPETPQIIYEEVGEFFMQLFNLIPQSLRDIDQVRSVILGASQSGKSQQVCVSLDKAFLSNVGLSASGVEVVTPDGKFLITEDLELALAFAFRRKKV